VDAEFFEVRENTEQPDCKKMFSPSGWRTDFLTNF